MKFDFRKLLVTKTLAVTFVLLILLGNYMFVPRLFGKETPAFLALVFNSLIYLSIIQAVALVLSIIWKSYFTAEEPDDES